MVTANDYRGVNQCVFDFIWHSRFACSPCRLDQVDIVESFCDEKGFSKVHATRKADEYCVVDFTPESVLKQWPEYKTDEKMGVYTHKGQKYVTKPKFAGKCDLIKDI